jgi:hypothetical protein
MLTQFVVESTLRNKKAQSVHTKLLLQMIAKRGNILWVPEIRPEMADTLDRVMLVGIDTSSSGGHTIMSACATINSTFSGTTSAFVPYDGIEKKFTAMVQVSVNCLEAYVTRNKEYPK